MPFTTSPCTPKMPFTACPETAFTIFFAGKSSFFGTLCGESSGIYFPVARKNCTLTGDTRRKKKK